MDPPSTSPSFFGTPTSSVRDTDDDEIISHHIPSPPVDFTDADMDVIHDVGAANEKVPHRTVRLMLPNHVHLAFPGCTPSTPATSQQIPQVSSQFVVKHLLTYSRTFPAIQRR
jgi:hypothetical protein